MTVWCFKDVETVLHNNLRVCPFWNVLRGWKFHSNSGESFEFHQNTHVPTYTHNKRVYDVCRVKEGNYLRFFFPSSSSSSSFERGRQNDSNGDIALMMTLVGCFTCLQICYADGKCGTHHTLTHTQMNRQREGARTRTKLRASDYNVYHRCYQMDT